MLRYVFSIYFSRFKLLLKTKSISYAYKIRVHTSVRTNYSSNLNFDCDCDCKSLHAFDVNHQYFLFVFPLLFYSLHWCVYDYCFTIEKSEYWQSTIKKNQAKLRFVSCFFLLFSGWHQRTSHSTGMHFSIGREQRMAFDVQFDIIEHFSRDWNLMKITWSMFWFDLIASSLFHFIKFFNLIATDAEVSLHIFAAALLPSD